MWDLIVSVPDHCLSFYCVSEHWVDDAANKSSLKYQSPILYSEEDS